MSLEVIRCTESDDAAWNAFVNGDDRASWYHLAEWRQVNAQAFGHRSCYLAARDAGRIVGIFPLVQVKSVLFGNIACSLPFVNYGGPIAQDQAVETALLDAAVHVAHEWRADYVEIRSRHDLGGQYPSSEHKVSMNIDLAPDPDTLWSAFKSNHRNEIRKGYKNGLSARIGGRELAGDFYTVLSESWRDLGTPIYSRDYIDLVAETFADSIRIAVVYSGDEPVAAAFDGLHRTTIEGLWMGIRAKYRSQFAGYVLYWELIKNGCERGYRSFHLGRSTAQSGGETFKRKWNATLTQLYWHYILSAAGQIPQLNVQNPKYRLAINAWQRLPVPVTQLIGPFIARSIP